MVNVVVFNSFPHKKGTALKYVGIDLHKQSLRICVVDQSQTVLQRARLSCVDEMRISKFLENLGALGAVVEATARGALKTFAEPAPSRERQQRELLLPIPGVGFVTTELVLAEIADSG